MATDDEQSSSERDGTGVRQGAERWKAEDASDQESVFGDPGRAVVNRVETQPDRPPAAPRPGGQLLAAVPVARVRDMNGDDRRAGRADNGTNGDSTPDAERARPGDQLATRDEFLSMVGHDLRNMLQATLSFAELIVHAVSRENHTEEVLMHTQRIERLVARMNRLIGDLVDVATIEAGTLAVTREVGDPAQVVSEAVDTYQAQAAAGGVSLVCEIPQAPSRAAFDPARIHQVLINLLGNALKFTPAGGKVVVRLDRVEDELRFCVIDSGVGIPADKLEAIFVRFLQVAKNDRRGVGLGLYISKCIVQGHGGRIWAESTPGEGSTFCFTLPVTAGNA